VKRRRRSPGRKALLRGHHSQMPGQHQHAGTGRAADQAAVILRDRQALVQAIDDAKQ
jgi:hypothetical protein